jgi:hypothetical protein
VASLVQVASCFGVLEYQKFQITNIKQITMTKFEIPKLFFVLVIEYWNVRFVCNFSFGVPTRWVGPRFGAWSLGFHRIDLSISPANSHIKEKPFLVSIPSADDGDGKTGKGELACYICFQTMVYKEAKN